MQAIPNFPQMVFPPLQLQDWKRALRSARKRTMRGADGWSVQELLWLSDEFTSLLLRIFQRAEQLACWPEQLSTWGCCSGKRTMHALVGL